MFTESFHNILKNVYLDNKQNRRVDHLLSILLKIARDKAFGRFQKLNKGKMTHRVSEINKRHRTSELMQTTVKSLQDSVWTIESQERKGITIYTVQYVADCSSCKMRCSSCSACVHMYTCTCLDSITHTTVCKHIHHVHSRKPVAAGNNTSNPDDHNVMTDQYFKTILGTHLSDLMSAKAEATSITHNVLTLIS